MAGGVRARVFGGGFSLVELLIALAVFAVLTGIAIPFFGDKKYQAEVAVAVRDVGVLQYRIDKYYSDNNAYPTTLADLALDPSETVDPWGYPYQYINHALVNGNGHVRRDRNLNPLNADYDLYSVGRDGLTKMPITQAESQDDVIRAGQGTYVGLASQF